MKIIVRDQISEMLTTVWEGVKFAKAKECNSQDSFQMLCDCYAVMQSVNNSLQKELSQERYSVYQGLAEQICAVLEQINQLIQNGQYPVKESKQVKELIHTMQKELKDEEELEYDIVFLPYKASMWDSMESIWRVAEEDPRCHAYVIPIPYYDRNPDFSLGTMHYEGDLFPDYVPITHYTKYNLLEKKPDVIYIHNPYDDYNRVSSVHPAFYSDKLKQYTKKLVYVPYFIPGAYESVEKAADFCTAKGINNADIVVAQSEVHKQMLVANGKEANKVAVLGNPKLEYVLNHLEDTEIPKEWKQKIGDKEAVLVCLSVTSYLNWSEQGCIDLYDWLIDVLIHKYNKTVIYRPHPLLENTIQSMRPARYEEYQTFLSKYINTDNFILDNLPDAMPAIKASACMISDYSSLCFSYMMTGKPVGMLTFGHDEEKFNRLHFALDYRTCYIVNIGFYLAWRFRRNKPELYEELRESDIKNIIKFGEIEEEKQQLLQHIETTCLSNVLQETEEERNSRIAKLEEQILKLTTGCGAKIHSCLLNELKK